METSPAARNLRQPFRDDRGPGAIVFDPARLQQATPALFDPAAYANDAVPVTGEGGRGSAWFVRGAFGDAVLRRYRRGGWAARVSERNYLWQGEARVRSLAEFALLQDLQSAGLPVPAPIAAGYRRGLLTYTADILVARLPGVSSFARCMRDAGAAAPWAAAGTAIARFHRHGAHHADLNAHNILVDNNAGLWLIDWDKGRIEPGGPGPWCEAVLDRLERSLRKLGKDLPQDMISQGMQVLRNAHQRGVTT